MSLTERLKEAVSEIKPESAPTRRQIRDGFRNLCGVFCMLEETQRRVTERVMIRHLASVIEFIIDRPPFR
jgi:hypothetical protein